MSLPGKEHGIDAFVGRFRNSLLTLWRCGLVLVNCPSKQVFSTFARSMGSLACLRWALFRRSSSSLSPLVDLSHFGRGFRIHRLRKGIVWLVHLCNVAQLRGELLKALYWS